MRPSLARAVCRLSFACLLSIRPSRAVKAIAARRSLAIHRQLDCSLIPRGGRQLTVARNHTRVHAMQTQSWQYPTPLSFPSKTKHTATVILLHGLGDTARGWADFAPMLQMQMPHVKFVFPTAPTRPITLNGGMRMTGWFDILSLDRLKLKEDRAGLDDAMRCASDLSLLLAGWLSISCAMKRMAHVAVIISLYLLSMWTIRHAGMPAVVIVI